MNAFETMLDEASNFYESFASNQLFEAGQVTWLHHTTLPYCHRNFDGLFIW